MKLFVTFGSWGEIAPLLEIALRLRDRGEHVEFCTTAYAEQVERYGIKCHSFPEARKHADTLDDFMRAHLIGRMQAMYEVIASAKPSSIVSAFYCWPALAYAENESLSCVATTTSPYYFLHTEPALVFKECIAEYQTLKGSETPNFQILGLYPWYLHSDCGVVNVGFPELLSIAALSAEVAKFIEEPYGVISRGTVISTPDLDRMVNAIHAHGLKCLYLGREQCKADLTTYTDNHREAVKRAAVCVTHAGIGTTVDCMGSPMVVVPCGYDQFYNAQRLIDLRVAVSNRSTIKAIEQAMQPRSVLPNTFNEARCLQILGMN